MKRFQILMFTLMFAPLIYSQEKEFIVPEVGVHLGKSMVSHSYLFPFPLALDDQYITFSYQSELACTLELTHGGGLVHLYDLPPLWGDMALGERYTLFQDLNLAFSSLSLRNSEGDPVDFTFLISGQSETEPLFSTALFEQILDRSRPVDGDYLLKEWITNDILVFDFADYDAQDRYFKRLAFYMEKPGYRGTLVSDEELEGKHAWNAHDYGPEGLAGFYNLAKEQEFPLNQEELDFLQILLVKGILTLKDGTYHQGVGAVISISRETDDYLRHRFLTHEMLHGIFFTDPQFREELKKYWNSLTEQDREIWRTFMLYNFYDPSDEVLMYNELLGYTLQLYRSEVKGYFSYRFGKTLSQRPELGELFDPYMDTLPDFMLEVYDALLEIVKRRYPYGDGAFHDDE